ncbi:prepilin-type N-terminal cleavage/methylation domain-containing protein [Paraglaciecola sp.]|uniref:type IV pilus modification PilV family protein n=1 Tax=Paraglaciecola sp. TaxID=1920173 RepID=UPI003EF8E2E5
MLVKPIKGFTLVELVIGLVVFAIAMTLFVSLIVPQAIRSVDPIFQVRAAELGQALISEISNKPFDENSSRVGGFVRCNEYNPSTDSTIPCSVIGQTTGIRLDFNDVDDYNGYTATGSDIRNSLNQTLQVGTGAASYNLYEGFSLSVSVYYDDNFDGIDDTIASGNNYVGNNKFIKVTVTTPNNEDIIFSTYRANY